MGAAIPEGAHPQPAGRREGAPTLQPLPSQLRLSLPRSRRFGFGKWGGGCHGNVPPSIATAPGGARGGISGPIRGCPQPTCGDQCRGREEQQQEPEPEPGRRCRRRHSRCRRTLGSARQHSTRHVGHLPQTGGGRCLPSPSGQLMRC